ncbi:MAG: prephenate dehydrogenase [Pseudoxanthomonas sp.]
MKTGPVIGIVGSQGAYGRWLGEFFATRMGLQVIGRDPADAGSITERELIDRADVLVFATPIRHTAAVIGDYVRIAAGLEARQLWLDVTSIKAEPVSAMLASMAEVVGLHPMTAPPKAPTLKGRVMVVCEARLVSWRDWVQQLLQALEAECVRSTPEHHDQVMAVVQAMVHATHLAQACVLREYAPQLGKLGELMPYRSASFEMDTAIMARILSMNPAIYEDIQFGNPYVAKMLEALVKQLSLLHAQVSRGDETSRSAFRQEFMQANQAALSSSELADGNYRFERIGYLLADMTETRTLSIHLPQDRAGSLRSLLDVFERHGVSLSSIHSSRTPAGEVHFRIGFDTDTQAESLFAAASEIDNSGIGRVLKTSA